jgi:hypothetical protein
MAHNAERKLDFQVIFRGESTPLQVVLFNDDISSIAVYSFTSKPLMETIDAEMEKFFKERGLA